MERGMAQTSPTVQGNMLIHQQNEHVYTVTVGTPDWYSWLTTASTFSFTDDTGTFRARKEKAGNKRGGWYWKAYRKRGGKLVSAYLGKSETLTLERLNAIASALVTQSDLENQRVTAASSFKSNPVPAAKTASFVHTTQFEHAPHQSHLFNLPTSLTSLIGREQDITQVCALLRRADVCLLTLIGTAGVGKTHLALHVTSNMCDDFPDGVVFVSLAPLHDASLVFPTIAQALGLREVGPQSVFEHVLTYLYKKHLLLVLDNFEQVVVAASGVEALVLVCPHLKVVVTSRTVLHVQNEHVFPVLPLALPDFAQLPEHEDLSQYAAVMLFIHRTQSTLPTFQLNRANARIIAEICVRLDGLPLAIELAAARMKLLSPQTLLTRLVQRLNVLTGGGPTFPERQQTLRNTLQWSYDLLDLEEQRLFRQLSVFANSCTLEAIEAVFRQEDQSGDVLNGISSLLDNSLLQRINQEDGEPRFMLLETVREYGKECLVASGETETSERAHALYYLALAEQVAPRLRGGGQQLLWIERLSVEQENLRVALRWLIEHQETALAVRFSAALWWYWTTRGSFNEGQGFLEAALGLPHAEISTGARAQALCGAGSLALRQGNYMLASKLLEESVTCFRQLEDTRGSTEALLNLGLVRAYQQDFVQARSLMEQSIALSREVRDTWLLGFALDSLARLAWKQGDIETTRTLSEEGLVLAPQIGEIRGQISSRKLLASVALSCSDYAQAATFARELFTIAQEINDKESLFSSLFMLASIAKSQGNYDQALTFYNRSMTIAHETGSARNSSMVLSRLGDIAQGQGNHTQASAYYHESLSLAPTFEDQEVVGRSLLGLGRIARAEGRYWRAACLLSAAEVRLNFNTDMDPTERADFGRDVAVTRVRLGAEAYAKAREAGRKMTPEQALAVLEPSTLNSSSTHPDTLTAREVEVLHLVALGWTDAQVAEKLVISPRTVQGHLRSIYNKIDVTSRSAATRYAIEHRVV